MVQVFRAVILKSQRFKSLVVSHTEMNITNIQSCSNISDQAVLDKSTVSGEKSSVKSRIIRRYSPRIKRTPVKTILKDSSKPYLYQMAWSYRLSFLEEQRCLSMLRIFQLWQATKFEKEEQLQRKISLLEWAKVCNISVKQLCASIEDARRAQHLLVMSHLRLVFAICRDFIHQGLSFDDLVQEGILGLLRATKKFQGCKGFRFSTYASWWVHQSLQRALAKHRHPIRLPVHVIDALKHIRRQQEYLSLHHGQILTAEEMSRHIRIPSQKITYYWQLASHQLPVYSMQINKVTHLKRKQMNYTKLSSLYEIFLRDDLEQAFSILNFKERETLYLRYGWFDGKQRTLKEIGKILAISEEGVRRVEKKALEKIRKSEYFEALRLYL
eukprot:jgi/Galph1/1972/GphlegSOOS_G630.1